MSEGDVVLRTRGWSYPRFSAVSADLMSARLVSLALLFGWAASAAAQPAFGLKAGLNVSDVRYSDEDAPSIGEETGALLGVVAGAFVEFPVSPAVAIRPEVLFSQKGFSFSGSFEDGSNAFTYDVNYRVNYLEVPVLAQVDVPVSPLARLSLLAGPAVSFHVDESLSQESALNGEVITSDGDADLNGQNVFASYDVSGVLGAAFGSGPFAVDLRYTLGLTDANRNEEEDPSAPAFYNRTFSATFSYRLR